LETSTPIQSRFEGESMCMRPPVTGRLAYTWGVRTQATIANTGMSRSGVRPYGCCTKRGAGVTSLTATSNRATEVTITAPPLWVQVAIPNPEPRPAQVGRNIQRKLSGHACTEALSGAEIAKC
jgi:hypothetical protein